MVLCWSQWYHALSFKLWTLLKSTIYEKSLNHTIQIEFMVSRYRMEGNALSANSIEINIHYFHLDIRFRAVAIAVPHIHFYRIDVFSLKRSVEWQMITKTMQSESISYERFKLCYSQFALLRLMIHSIRKNALDQSDPILIWKF